MDVGYFGGVVDVYVRYIVICKEYQKALQEAISKRQTMLDTAYFKVNIDASQFQVLLKSNKESSSQ